MARLGSFQLGTRQLDGEKEISERVGQLGSSRLGSFQLGSDIVKPYEPPESNVIDFELGRYSAPSTTEVNFNLGGGTSIVSAVVDISGTSSLISNASLWKVSEVELIGSGELNSDGESDSIYYIGDTEIPHINSAEIDSSVGVEEIDLVDKDTNMVVSNKNNGEGITINAILTKQGHSENKDVKLQRDEIKQLKNSISENNKFYYRGRKGTLSITDITVPESSDMRNIREVEIQAVFLPWPKNNPESW